MQVNVHHERMLVISDLHLGNHLFHDISVLDNFIDFAINHGYSLCINGDGVDIMQSSFKEIAKQVPPVFARLSRARKRGLHVYLVVGNHDLVFEHFLQDWQMCEIVPFLNLNSGDKRVRIEHGHIYDSVYVSSPGIYNFLVGLAGMLMVSIPSLYRVWEKIELAIYGSDVNGTGGWHGEDPVYERSARELAERGFDTIIFGHTHRPGVVDLGDDKVYINQGSWIYRPYYVEINNGKTELKTFSTN
ncbi:MAG: metallophosphoesterase [Desulfurivibrio sp.]|nr:metallophosphoesterase [Desulfurivibrio sp.]